MHIFAILQFDAAYENTRERHEEQKEKRQKDNFSKIKSTHMGAAIFFTKRKRLRQGTESVTEGMPGRTLNNK